MVASGATYSPRKTSRTAASRRAAPRVSFMPSRLPAPPPRSRLSDERNHLGLESLRDGLHLAVDEREVGEVREALDLVRLVEVPAHLGARLGLDVGGPGRDGRSVVLVVLGAQAEVRELLGHRRLGPLENAPALGVVEAPEPLARGDA